MTQPEAGPRCGECAGPATVQWQRDATDAEQAAYRAQFAHLPDDSPALTGPFLAAEYRCCAHHGDQVTCPGCPQE